VGFMAYATLGVIGSLATEVAVEWVGCGLTYLKFAVGKAGAWLPAMCKSDILVAAAAGAIMYKTSSIFEAVFQGTSQAFISIKISSIRAHNYTMAFVSSLLECFLPKDAAKAQVLPVPTCNDETFQLINDDDLQQNQEPEDEGEKSKAVIEQDCPDSPANVFGAKKEPTHCVYQTRPWLKSVSRGQPPSAALDMTVSFHKVEAAMDLADEVKHGTVQCGRELANPRQIMEELKALKMDLKEGEKVNLLHRRLQSLMEGEDAGPWWPKDNDATHWPFKSLKRNNTALTIIKGRINELSNQIEHLRQS